MSGEPGGDVHGGKPNSVKVGDVVRLLRPWGEMPAGAEGPVLHMHEDWLYVEFPYWGVGGVRERDVEVVSTSNHDE